MGEGYQDWLAEIRKAGGELAWIRQNSAGTLHNSGRTAAQMRQAVMGSKRLGDIIGQLSVRRGVAESVVRAEAQQILSTMAHDIHYLTAVQPIGYSLAKIFGRIFSHIWVNSAQMLRIQALLASDPSVPIVWLPTHRSYLDFLLLSLLSYHFHIPLPAICAADDFRSSHLLGESLRRCGAFFIRRSFREDPLYWAIFSEYVQQHLLHADRPIEFFVEGQRSRTGKSLSPRTGLLQVVLEPFFRAQLYDTILVPISIDYDRIVEEMLHAQELIGFAKPKETTSGLLRARTVLNDCFGNIRVTVGEPISVRQYFFANGPMATDIRLEMIGKETDEMERELARRVRGLALTVVRQQNMRPPLASGPFIALTLLRSLNSSQSSSSSSSSSPFLISLNSFEQRVNSLFKLFKKCATERRTTREQCTEADIRHFIELRRSHLSIVAPGDSIQMLPLGDHSPPFLLNSILLANQANSLIHSLTPFCLVSILRMTNRQQMEPSEGIFNEYCFLRRLYSYEFVHDPTGLSDEFRHAFGRTTTFPEFLSNLADIFMPFLLAFHSIFSILLDSYSSGTPLPLPDLAANTHHQLLALIRHHPLHFPSQFGSTDLVKNALNGLRAFQIAKLDSEKRLILDFAELAKLQNKLKRMLAGVGRGKGQMLPSLTLSSKAKL